MRRVPLAALLSELYSQLVIHLLLLDHDIIASTVDQTRPDQTRPGMP